MNIDTLLLNYNAMKCIPAVSKLNYESVLNFVGKKRPLKEGHYECIFNIKDFIRLGPREQNEEFQDKLLRWISHRSESLLDVRSS